MERAVRYADMLNRSYLSPQPSIPFIGSFPVALDANDTPPGRRRVAKSPVNLSSQSSRSVPASPRIKLAECYALPNSANQRVRGVRLALHVSCEKIPKPRKSLGAPSLIASLEVPALLIPKAQGRIKGKISVS